MMIMKTQCISLLLALASSALVAGAEPKKPVYRDAATHEELANKLSRIQQKDPMLKRRVVEGEDPSVVHRPADLLKQSDIISFGGYATLVPKRAILSAPADYQKLLKLQPGAKIIGWKDFFSRNRAWITTIEVTRAEAEGNQVLPEATQEKVSKSRNLVVATCFGGPISVLPAKEPVETVSVDATSER